MKGNARAAATLSVAALLFLACGAPTAATTTSAQADTTVGITASCGLGSALVEVCRTIEGIDPDPTSQELLARACGSGLSLSYSCNGVPPSQGVSCNLCAGIGTSAPVTPDLGTPGGATIGITATASVLTCWEWSYDGQNATYAGTHGIMAGAGVLKTPVGDIGCGGSERLDTGATGMSCSASIGANIGALQCSIGISVGNPQDFINDLNTIIQFDQVAATGPCANCVTVGCFQGEGASNVGPIVDRCRTEVAKMDSGAKSDLGYALSCKDVFGDACYTFSSCPQDAFTFCSNQMGQCIQSTLQSCESPSASAGGADPCSAADDGTDCGGD